MELKFVVSNSNEQEKLEFIIEPVAFVILIEPLDFVTLIISVTEEEYKERKFDMKFNIVGNFASFWEGDSLHVSDILDSSGKSLY